MSNKRIAVEATKVSIGMYIAMLDRPWLETPFVFQGFEIKDRLEIELVQSYCSVVYVDIDRGHLSPAEIRALVLAQSGRQQPTRSGQSARRKSNKWLRRLRNLLMRWKIFRRPAGEPHLESDGYPIQTTLRGEAEAAFAAYKRISLTYQEMIARVEKTGRMDIGALKKAVQPVIDSVLRNPNAMAWTIFSRRRSGLNYKRAVGTSVWCLMFGRHLGFDRQGLEDLTIGGLLLDVGNVRIPAEIVAAEGEITPQQFEILSQHVEFGLAILEKSGELSQNIIDMVQFHHERADGSGYPAHLQRNQIPVYGRIAAIADSYDAMTTENAYSRAYAAYDVARALNEMRGNQFATEVVEQFLRTLGVFPTASVVELSNGSIGVVLEQNRDNALRPKVMVLLDKMHKPLDKPKILEMSDLPLDVTHAKAVWVVQGHEHGAFGIDPMDYFNPSAG